MLLSGRPRIQIHNFCVSVIFMKSVLGKIFRNKIILELRLVLAKILDSFFTFELIFKNVFLGIHFRPEVYLR